MIWTSAFVARRSAVPANETATITTSIAPTTGGSTTPYCWGCTGIGTVALGHVSYRVAMRKCAYREMSNLTAGVAASASDAAAQSQRRAVSLDVTNALAVIALLGWRSLATLFILFLNADVLSVVLG